MREILNDIFKNTEAVEDYKILKENMTDMEFSISTPKAVYQHAEVRVQTGKYR